MFEDSLLESGGRLKTKRGMTTFFSMILQVFLIGLLVLIPLLFTEALPKQQLMSFLVAPPPPPPPPPPPAAAPVKVVKGVLGQFDAGRLTAPKVIPKEIANIKEEELPPMAGTPGVVGGVPGGVPGGTPGGVLGGIIGAVPSAAPPPPPVKEAPKAVTPKSIRVGGNVQAAKLVRQPKPTYPPLAKQARIQGIVRFNAVIGRDGQIA